MTKYILEDLEEPSQNEDVSEEENHTSNNESVDSSDDNYSDEGDNVDTEIVLSKDGTVIWNSCPIQKNKRILSANIIKKIPGVTIYATSRIYDIKSSFEAVFDYTVEKEIINFTNAEGRRVYGDKWKDMEISLFQAYVGILLLAGVYRSNGEATKSLWDKQTGRPIFRATMSHETFEMISRVTRLDNKSTRQERRKRDKLAAVRDIWEKWIDVLPKLCNPSENVTVDEQLVAFRGRCPFKQYIPSKPAKYGIKIWALCDSKNSYLYQAQIYTGKEVGAKPEKNQGMRVVADLTKDLKGQNVTCDNFFTSYKLGTLLLKRGITMLGTVRKNKAELPEFKNKELHGTSFYFTKDTTILNYVAKKHKNVLLMSTSHSDRAISGRDDKKPQMILDYNETKGAVDTLDQLVATYTCKRKTNRWPMIVFYHMLDVSAYNAFVLWTSIYSEWNKNCMYKRRIFLEKLGFSLIEKHIASRTYIPRTAEAFSIVKSVKEKYQEKPDVSINPKHKKRARCFFCETKNDNKTSFTCSSCNKYICKIHVTYYCPNCEGL